MGLAGPVDPAAALAVSTVTGDVRKAMTFGALFLSSALLHAAEVSITTLYPWKVKEFAEEERCDLGVPSCRGAFTPSMQLVSIRRRRGWFLFRV